VPLQALHERTDLPPRPRLPARRVKSVLIAEDDPDTAAAIKATLEEHLSVETATINNGALVLDEIAAHRPDLLILDVNLPGLSGVDVFDLVQANPSFSTLPVLFLTAAPDRARRAFARKGIRDVMRKPFDGRALAGKVADLLGRAQKVA